MSCAACASRIETALRRVPGVVEADVNFALARATVSYDPRITPAAAPRQAIEAAGYGVTRLDDAGAVAGGVPVPLELAVHGMSCAACAARIEKALAEVPGVAQATVNFATGRAHVVLAGEAGALPSPEALIAAVEGAGYGARRVDAPPSPSTRSACEACRSTGSTRGATGRRSSRSWRPRAPCRRPRGMCPIGT